MHDDIIKAHTHSINHRKNIELDSTCGCFFCLEIFHPKEIVEWIQDRLDETALCPYCDIDSVIGESSGYPITKEFLTAMRKHWFW